MKTNKCILNIITILLIVFWLYVALDKLWNLDGFHASLLKQPFPNWWADVLFWLLPVMELGVALLFALRRFRSIPYLLSALLMFAFTVYIGLGVAGVYAKRPCSCASIFRGMSWEQHLIVNIGLLILSLIGWYLSSRPPRRTGMTLLSAKVSTTRRCTVSAQRISVPAIADTLRRHLSRLLRILHNRNSSIAFHRWFCRTYALFPGRPVPYKPE